jgi:tetratricopeptide (TPR) repeat protein
MIRKSILLIAVLVGVACGPVGADAQDLRTLHEQALQLLSGGHAQEAVGKFAELNAQFPNEYHLETNYGFALMKVGKNQEAAAHLQHAVELNPQYDTAWLNLGVALESSGKPREALAALQQYSKLAKDEKQRAIATAHIKLIQDELKRAVSDTSKTDYLQSIIANSRSRWTGERIPVKVYVADGSKIKAYRSEYSELVKQAFADWQEAAPKELSFAFVTDEKDANVTVKWITDTADVVNLSEGGDTKYGLDGKGMKWAHIQLLLGDSTPRPITPAIMRWTTLHEVGHALGLLGHSPDPNDIMYINAPQLDTQPGLSPRDKETMKKFYSAPIGESWLALNDEGVEAARKGDYKTALEKYEQAMKLTDDLTPRKNAIRSEYSWAVQLAQSGDMKSPEAHFKAAVQLEEKLHDENFPVLIESYVDYLHALKRDSEAASIQKLKR